MPIYYLHLIKLAIFLLALVIFVPRTEIRRLTVYGIIFGSTYDVIGLTIGHLTNAFRWINFAPFGYGHLPLDSPVSWCSFYIIYFYLLPKHKPLLYIFPVAGIVMSMIYSRVLVNLGMFIEPNFLLRLANFTIWFSFATWGYLKLNAYVEARHKSIHKT
ncbi:hypothetical protein [Desulfosporosinus fructosivorans]